MPQDSRTNSAGSVGRSELRDTAVVPGKEQRHEQSVPRQVYDPAAPVDPTSKKCGLTPMPSNNILIASGAHLL